MAVRVARVKPSSSTKWTFPARLDDEEARLVETVFSIRYAPTLMSSALAGPFPARAQISFRYRVEQAQDMFTCFRIKAIR